MRLAFAVVLAACAANAAAEENSSAALALAARDQGEPARAAALWDKAVELAPTDAFLLNQKAWSALALGKIKDARKGFGRATQYSTEGATLSESQLGLGVALTLDSDFKAAAKTFEALAEQSPYLYPIASTWLAQVAVRMRKPDVASLYLRHSLEQDPLHPSALDLLGELYEEHKMPEEARQCFRQALAVNAGDSKAKDGLRKAEQQLDKTGTRSPSRRIASPLLQRPVAPPPSSPLRVAIFSDTGGSPSPVRKLRFASGAESRLLKDGKELASASPNLLWEATWDPESRVLEIRDQGKKLRYAGRDVVRVEPKEQGSSVLLRDIDLGGAAGVDTGDRELRGAVELRPSASGYFVINELGVEEYLYSQLAALSPAGAPVEALKAEAVALRSGIDGAKKRFGRAAERFDLCDSSRCQLYLGLAQERSDATAAVQATAGETLRAAGAALDAALHAHCGGVTEDGVLDGRILAASAPAPVDRIDASSAPAAAAAAASTATVQAVALSSSAAPVDAPAPERALSASEFVALWRTPVALERMLHEDPSKSFYCGPSKLVPTNWERWVRILEPRQIEEAAAAGTPIGALRSIKTLGRTAAGRVTGIELVGASGRWSAKGEDELGPFLARLGLKSALVSFQPLYRDQDISYVVAWGAGSGDGHGLCVAGALGQAAEGRNYQSILRHYFPGAQLR